MAQADSTSTTRRSFVRLAGVAAAASITPRPAAANCEDAEMISLAARLDQSTLALNAAADRGDDPAVQAHYREGSALVDQIFEYAATTIPGAQAKCRALYWINGDKAEHWDCKYSFDLVEDLLNITAQTGR